MAIDRDKLSEHLKDYPSAASVWFATRCAMRVTPVLASYRHDPHKFSFWGDSGRKHLCSVFLALDSALSMAYRSKASRSATLSAANSALAAANAAKTANYGKNAAVFAAYSAATAAAATINAAYAADAAVAAVNAYQNADVGCYIAQTFSAASDNAFANDDAIEIDLSRISSYSWSLALWPDGCPEKMAKLERTFLDTLRGLGLDYWAHEYECWVRSEFCLTRRHRREVMPRELIEKGPDAILAFLEAAT